MTPFAFYGRVSTEDQQDPESYRGWQLARSRSLIAPHSGDVVAEYFDIGTSRSLPWKRRPQATALLQGLRDPDRGFGAVAATEGRFLGGRPPYGYQLVDLGPHPNPGKAAAGQREHGLEPDPVAAPVVARIFREYVAGTGL